MRKRLLTLCLIFLSLSAFTKAHGDHAQENEDHDGVDLGSDEGMTFEHSGDHDGDELVKLETIVAKYLHDDSKMWKKGQAQQVFMEYFAHLSAEEYKRSVEDFLESHGRNDEANHPSVSDLMNAHQIRHFCDHIFDGAETVSNDMMKSSLDMDLYMEWLDTV